MADGQHMGAAARAALALHVGAGMLQNLKSAGVPSPCRLPRAGERCFALALAPAIAKWRQVRRSPSSSAKAAKVARVICHSSVSAQFIGNFKGVFVYLGLF